MKRVTGIGGIFFKSKDPEKSLKWYEEHLGVKVQQGYGIFEWKETENTDKKCSTIWSPFEENTKYFAPSEKPFMFNFRVENLEELLKVLREEGVAVIDKIEEYDYGKFGWILDLEGNKIELWEPID